MVFRCHPPITPQTQVIMSTGSGRIELEGLLSLINSATHDAMAIYENSGHGVPSVHSATTHPLDAEATTLSLRKAIRTLEGACEQLCTTLAPPNHTLLNRSMVHFYPTAMRVVVEARIPDMLIGKPQGLSVSELAQKSNLEARKLRKILRALATRHIFREVRPDVYSNNRLSLTLVDSPAADLLLLMTGMVREASFSLPDTLTDSQFGPSSDPSKSAFMYHHKDKGLNGTLFEYLHANPDVSKRFGSGMVGWAKLTDNASLVQDFPWNDMPAGTTFCDVGGGIGSVSMALVKAHPHLKVTLQDLPNVIEQASEFWAKECPHAVQEQRVDFVAVDFMKEGPVKDHNVYYIRHVIHDWPDASSVVILKNIRQAMNANSRLFIHEYILQAVTDETSVGAMNTALAPKPLLPNYGAGNMRRMVSRSFSFHGCPYYPSDPDYNQDLNMLCMMNAGERSLDEFIALGAQAGLEFVQLWDFAENAMVEFKPV
ncbi:hypothetical protein PILCRDRAFT_595321 [Piloderma croceum F 1598]|uniref:Uncharacterized protein n=1 Tax=Piloderma croceum (strain F 1598) TaxID=765440 RepID=A0A0C3FEM2_PILCF|nr:hypothetical protein PILCRDRAFT_595321 [Piloderma croceum F 1598]